MPGRGSRVSLLPWGGAGAPWGHPARPLAPREGAAPLGVVQESMSHGGAGMPGRDPESGLCPGEVGTPWGHQSQALPQGGAGTPGGSPESMSHGGAGIAWWGDQSQALPLWRRAHSGPAHGAQEGTVSPVAGAACRIISLGSGCPRKGWGEDRAHPIQVWALVSAMAGWAPPQPPVHQPNSGKCMRLLGRRGSGSS